ncbi:MAG: hypothetical protein K0R97_1164 [Oerskovia sp.]|jgi:hypothetical protein|nr:hypothetical protein [Oerskovia sp.]
MDPASISERVPGYLRTYVPVLWGSVVAAILREVLPYVPGDVGATLADWLSSEATLALVTTAAIAAWYALWRWAEPHVPDWLTRLVLGSAQTPVYAGRHRTTPTAGYVPSPTSGSRAGPRG